MTTDSLAAPGRADPVLRGGDCQQGEAHLEKDCKRRVRSGCSMIPLGGSTLDFQVLDYAPVTTGEVFQVDSIAIVVVP
jgi:hypothetical protein